MIEPKGTDVILLYGVSAANHFAPMVNQWTRMVSPYDWDGLRFVLVSDENADRELCDEALKLLDDRNTIFYRLGSPVSVDNFMNWLVHEDGNVVVHVISAIDEKATSLQELKSFIKSLQSVDFLSVRCLYYFLLYKNSLASSRDELISLVDDGNSNVFLLGEIDALGGSVAEEDRWKAVSLATLLATAELLPLNTQVASLGYSALNADGSEFDILAENTVCRSLLNQLNPDNAYLSDTEARRLLQLPDQNIDSRDALEEWLREQVKKRAFRISSSEWQNAWATAGICFREDDKTVLAPQEAVKRMQCFIDLNYAGERGRQEAKTFASEVYQNILDRLRTSVATACLPVSAIRSMIQELNQLSDEMIRPEPVVYPGLPFLKTKGKMDDYLKNCRLAIQKSLKGYILQKSIAVYAAELAKVYSDLEKWVSAINPPSTAAQPGNTVLTLLQGNLKKMENSSRYSPNRLKTKYKNLSTQLELLNPSLEMLLDGMGTQYYFDEKGVPIEQAWKKLVSHAGQKIRRRIPGYEGSFFSALHTEFTEETERNNFFDSYLRDGPRMYYNQKAPQAVGYASLIAEQQLADGWFIKHELYGVSTDNAENLTLYTMDKLTAADFLREDTIHFKGDANGSSAGVTFAGAHKKVAASGENSIFGNKAAAVIPKEAENPYGLKLFPDAKGDYQLSWKWNGNDKTACVRLEQFGEPVGKPYCINSETFIKNNKTLNVTQNIMEGKMIPSGVLSVTILDDNGHVFIRCDSVPGKRALVKYRISGKKLQVRFYDSQYASSVVLRTTNLNGDSLYYPLYPPYSYDDLSLDDGKIVMNPAEADKPVYIIAEN